MAINKHEQRPVMTGSELSETPLFSQRDVAKNSQTVGYIGNQQELKAVTRPPRVTSGKASGEPLLSQRPAHSDRRFAETTRHKPIHIPDRQRCRRS